MAKGVNKYLAGPCSSTTGKNTMQMDRVATIAGTAICRAPSRIATVRGLPMCWLRLMFSTSTVASSTSMPMARLRPPMVMRFRVWPDSFMPITPNRMASGMLVQTRIMERQEPMNRKIITDTRAEATRASLATERIASRTNSDWSTSNLSSSPLGAAAWMPGRASLAASTTARVLASAFFRMAMYTARRPSMRTMLVWSAKPS